MGFDPFAACLAIHIRCVHAGGGVGEDEDACWIVWKVALPGFWLGQKEADRKGEDEAEGLKANVEPSPGVTMRIPKADAEHDNEQYEGTPEPPILIRPPKPRTHAAEVTERFGDGMRVSRPSASKKSSPRKRMGRHHSLRALFPCGLASMANSWNGRFPKELIRASFGSSSATGRAVMSQTLDR